MSDIERLRNLIDDYWDIAWKEGRENRSHDDEKGSAMSTRSEIEAILSRLEAKGSPNAADDRPAAWWHERHGMQFCTVEDRITMAHGDLLYKRPQLSALPEGWKIERDPHGDGYAISSPMLEGFAHRTGNDPDNTIADDVLHHLVTALFPEV